MLGLPKVSAREIIRTSSAFTECPSSGCSWQDRIVRAVVSKDRVYEEETLHKTFSEAMDTVQMNLILSLVSVLSGLYKFGCFQTPVGYGSVVFVWPKIWSFSRFRRFKVLLAPHREKTLIPVFQCMFGAFHLQICRNSALVQSSTACSASPWGRTPTRLSGGGTSQRSTQSLTTSTEGFMFCLRTVSGRF